jgi:asparagine synthase (glutamine-hydrolysing)
MCGTGGMMICDDRAPDATAFDRLQAALALGVPTQVDDTFSDSIGLVSTPLAIINLRTGDQPLVESQGAVLVANEASGQAPRHLSLRDPNVTSANTCRRRTRNCTRRLPPNN